MMNPFYWLELRIRAREKRLWIIALFFLVSMLLISGGILAIALVRPAAKVTPGQQGQVLTYTLLFCHAAILAVLAPLASAGRIAQEREQRTLSALLNTCMPPHRMVWGKLLGTWTFIGWLTALMLPLLAVALAWGGLSFGRALAILLSNLLVGMVLSTVSLGFSGLFGRSLTAYLVTGTFLLAWMVVLPILGAISMQLAGNGETAQQVIAHLCFYTHPMFPSIYIAAKGFEGELPNAGTAFASCFTGWLLVSIGGLTLACRGLKKEVY